MTHRLLRCSSAGGSFWSPSSDSMRPRRESHEGEVPELEDKPAHQDQPEGLPRVPRSSDQTIEGLTTWGARSVGRARNRKVSLKGVDGWLRINCRSDRACGRS